MNTGKEKQQRHVCPFCEEEISAASFPFCRSCKVTITYCSQCHQPVSADDKVCPHCRAEIKRKG